MIFKPNIWEEIMSSELTIVPKILVDKLSMAHQIIVNFSGFLGLNSSKAADSTNMWSREFRCVIAKVRLGRGLTKNEMSLIWQACVYLNHTNDGEVIKLAREISQTIKLSWLESITDLEQMRICVDLIRYSQNDFRFTPHGLFETVIQSVISGEIVDEGGIILIKEACEYCIESPEPVVKEMGFSMLGNLG